MDTLRLINPWQWIKCGRDFKDRPKGKYLGSFNFGSGVSNCMPRDDNIHIRWKTHAGDAAVAEWNWTFKFPRTSFLRNLWFKPFMMLEKEVTW